MTKGGIRLSNDDLDPVRAMVVAKVLEHQLDMKNLSRAAGRNDAYLQQFVRKGIPRRLPADVREMLADLLKVPPDLLGDVAPNLKRRQSATAAASARRQDANVPQLKMKVSTAGFSLRNGILNRGRSVAVFSCPGIIDEAYVTDWTERPAYFAGAGPVFAVWVPASVGRLRAGDLVFVHPAQPPDVGDAVVVVAANRIVSIGEMTQRRDTAASVLAKAGETAYLLPQHRIMRIAVAVFK